ncbi:hypothetical protein AWB74_01731 [Caballeronia arvi]|uniref:Uncharacterized protein n=1 Tax=Caballeronia arvi TaxID=1777135 RepID=A0A158HDU4_9BURK|nr:hypothetical protein [Caballeronia arvi]SAL42496.1 hypothetical protein AWB74_01731 [Caballeronia arvi]
MTQELLSTQAAAELVAAEIDESGGVTYWSRYLTNNRREDRSPPHRIPFQRIGGGAFYLRPDVAAFIAFEKSRRLGVLKLSGRAAEALRAFGIGEAGGGTTGRNLDCTLTAQLDSTTGTPYAQLVIQDPLLVFRVEPDQLRELHSEIAATLKAFERWAK